MTAPFLITGLPRSRTAWMAAVATDGRAVCFHEPGSRLDRWDAVFETVWHGLDCWARFVGISDHGLGFHLPEIMHRLAPRTLIIERPIDEVNASLARLGFAASNFCEVLAEYLAFEHRNIRRVDYAALGDAREVASCLQWLMPGHFVDRRRLARYQLLNIQADVPEARARAARADVSQFIPQEALRRLIVHNAS